jgi:hypothetical protein
MFVWGAAMVDRGWFCSSTAGPFSKVEGLFTVLMCADCQAARGHGGGPYPVVTRVELRAGLDMMATWALEQKAAAFSCGRTVFLEWLRAVYEASKRKAPHVGSGHTPLMAQGPWKVPGPSRRSERAHMVEPQSSWLVYGW